MQRTLPKRTTTIELSVLSCDDSKQIWRNMNIFQQQTVVTKEAVRHRRERELKLQCDASAGRVPYVPAPATEQPTDADARHNGMHAALQRLRPVAQREKARAAKTRLKQEETERLEAEELGTDGLEQFLDETLCNLPLSVRLCGQILYASKGLCWGDSRPSLV